MNVPFVYWGLPGLAGLTSLVIVCFLWRKRRPPLVSILIALMLLAADWALFHAGQRLIPDLAGKVLFNKIEWIGVVGAAPTLFLFALLYTGRDRWVRARNIALLYALPAITLLLAWSNELHHLVWARVWLDRTGPFPLAVFIQGPWFWPHAVYTYLLVLISAFWVVRHYLRFQRRFRLELVVLLIGLGAPCLANVIYLLRIGPWPDLDLTPIALNVTFPILAWGLLRFQLMEVVPVARDSVFEGLPDAVLVLDDQDRLVDLNPAAERLLDLTAARSLGLTAPAALVRFPTLVEHLALRARTTLELTLDRPDDQSSYALVVPPLEDDLHRPRGRLVLLRDITERKRAETDRERLIGDLQEALVKIKTLSGLLPICSSCKKIRDDQGYWQQIEVYLKDHANASLSPGLCPDCAQKLQGDHPSRK